MNQYTETMTAGFTLRNTRRKNNKSMIAIANEVGVTEAFISLVERDKQIPANEELMEKLAVSYGIERKTFFLLFGKLPSDVICEIAEYKDLANFLFEMTKRNLTKEEKAYHYDKLRLFL
jgi:transcriptional regulator with XRE-family HTH domain